MQRNSPLGELMDEIDMLYDYVDDFVNDVGKTRRITINEAFSDICHLIGGKCKNFVMPTFTENELTPMDYRRYGQDSNKRLLLFSGGKCSTAAAIFYKRRELRPILFYIRNTHQKFARESRQNYLDAIDISRKLGIEFVSMPMELNVYNPLCIMRMVNIALEYAIDNHLPHNISMGLFETTSIRNNPFELWGNSSEFTKFQEDLYRCTLTDFKLSFPIPSYSLVWDELMRRKDIIDLLNCDDEVDRDVLYIMKVDFGMEKNIDTSLYIRYLKRLKALMERSLGRRISVKQMWKRYFFYNIEQSKMYPKLLELLK